MSKLLTYWLPLLILAMVPITGGAFEVPQQESSELAYRDGHYRHNNYRNYRHHRYYRPYGNSRHFYYYQPYRYYSPYYNNRHNDGYYYGPHRRGSGRVGVQFYFGN